MSYCSSEIFILHQLQKVKTLRVSAGKLWFVCYAHRDLRPVSLTVALHEEFAVFGMSPILQVFQVAQEC